MRAFNPSLEPEARCRDAVFSKIPLNEAAAFTIQRMRASRSAQAQLRCPGRLASVADFGPMLQPRVAVGVGFKNDAASSI